MANNDKLDRVPPFIPIIWQDWASSLDIQSMSTSEEGLFNRFIHKQWVLGELPADPWALKKLLRVDHRTIIRFLAKYEHLFVGAQKHNSKCTVNVQQGYSKITVDITTNTVNILTDTVSLCICPLTLHNPKLRNLYNDVIFKLPLGTTEPNLTEVNLTEVTNDKNNGEPEFEIPSEFPSKTAKSVHA